MAKIVLSRLLVLKIPVITKLHKYLQKELKDNSTLSKNLFISDVDSWVTEWIDWVRIKTGNIRDRQENIQDDWMAQAGDEFIPAITEGAWKVAGVHGAEGVFWG